MGIQQTIEDKVSKYESATICTLGSHSALDICTGAKDHGMKNLVVCQKGREIVYDKYYKNRKTKIGHAGCVDETLILDKFSHITHKQNVNILNQKNSIFIPHRSFCVYVGYDSIEKDFSVPIFGNRWLLRAEERNTKKNQQFLLKESAVKIPQIKKSPDDIDTLCIVKASEAKRPWERAFFFASTPQEYYERSKKMIEDKTITEQNLNSALIEEFVLGAQFNFNFFMSPITEELELLGIDTRRQVNLDGWLRLPAKDQLAMPQTVKVKNIEAGHIACTIRESLLEQVYEIGEKFVKGVKKHYPDGIIGPFALQGALEANDKSEEISIFDVSFRVPGSPGTKFTPYTQYMFSKSVSVGNRIAYEISQAIKLKSLHKCVT